MLGRFFIMFVNNTRLRCTRVWSYAPRTRFPDPRPQATPDDFMQEQLHLIQRAHLSSTYSFGSELEERFVDLAFVDIGGGARPTSRTISAMSPIGG
jgi:hypothetical protein